VLLAARLFTTFGTWTAASAFFLASNAPMKPGSIITRRNSVVQMDPSSVPQHSCELDVVYLEYPALQWEFQDPKMEVR